MIWLIRVPWHQRLAVCQFWEYLKKLCGRIHGLNGRCLCAVIRIYDANKLAAFLPLLEQPVPITDWF